MDIRAISEELQDEMNLSSMNIIIHAGNAREYNFEALDHAMEGDFEQAKELMKKSREEITQAHNIQTKVVQKESQQEPYYYSMLFSHAQDTVMTIQSEYNMLEKMIAMIKLMLKKEGN